MTDGSELTAMVSTESGKLHMQTALGTFVFNLESVRQVCHRLLEMCLDETERQKGWSDS
jgi:hypothetical protein